MTPYIGSICTVYQTSFVACARSPTLYLEGLLCRSYLFCVWLEGEAIGKVSVVNQVVVRSSNKLCYRVRPACLHACEHRRHCISDHLTARGHTNKRSLLARILRRTADHVIKHGHHVMTHFAACAAEAT